MQPKLCIKCKKNMAVLFITKIENGNTLNEGYCLKCARSLGIPQIEQTIKSMGISEDDLDLLTDEMSNMFGQIDPSETDDDEVDSQTATFPLLNQLFGGNTHMPAQPKKPKEEEPPRTGRPLNVYNLLSHSQFFCGILHGKERETLCKCKSASNARKIPRFSSFPSLRTAQP